MINSKERQKHQAEFIAELFCENNELKAMVNALRAAAIHAYQCDENNSGYVPSLCCFQRSMDELGTAVESTPAQCLAAVRATSIEQFIADTIGDIGDPFDARLSTVGTLYINKLRATK